MPRSSPSSSLASSSAAPPVSHWSAGDKAAYVQQLFNRIAGRYDLLNDCISLGLHRHWKRRACQRLRLQPGDTVLDVCTGTGHLVQYLHHQVGTAGEVVGLDFSEGMLSVARQRFGQQRNVRFVQGDAMALPFEDQQFAAAVVAFGLRNVDDLGQTLAEMYRVVRPGGWVVSLDTNPEVRLPGFWWYFNQVMPRLGQWLGGDRAAYQYLTQSTQSFTTPAQLGQQFQQQGFTSVQVEPVGLGTAAIVAGQRPE